jgi:hypothetical protein
MARIRTIKPGFFLNEELAALSAHHRLLFIGLWTQADRKGRLVDKPARIKASLFPYESLDVNAMLNDLARAPKEEEVKFITRYQANNAGYIQINKFEEHQWPHHREPDSKLPPPPKTN